MKGHKRKVKNHRWIPERERQPVVGGKESLPDSVNPLRLKVYTDTGCPSNHPDWLPA